MNSSDATPDNSPPSSPLLSLPPPKAKRQPAARPRKPRPPKEVVLNIRPPGPPPGPPPAVTKPSISLAVTKPRSAATTQPRKRAPKKEQFLFENPFVEEAIVEKLVEKPRVQKPKKEKLVFEKPLVEDAVVEKLAVQKPRIEKPRIQKPKKLKLDLEKPLVDDAIVEKLVVQKPHVEKPRIERPRIEKPRIEKPHADKPPRKTKERAPKPTAVVPRVPKQLKRKEVPEPQESTDSDQELRALLLDQERKRALHSATRKLEDLLEVTTLMVEELQKDGADLQRLEEEKLRLLDELLVWEGLADNPYPPFVSALPSKKPKRVKK